MTDFTKLIAWLETKNPDEEYNPNSPFSCVFHQFYTATKGPRELTPISEANREFGEINVTEIALRNTTFGGALESARKIQENQPGKDSA